MRIFKNWPMGELLTTGTVAVIVTGVLIWAFVPAVQRAGFRPGSSAYVTQSFGQISLAMDRYAHEHGRLPPSAIYAKDGQPLLSWRVLLLRYLEHDQLYRKFHLDEPWDSPHNLALLPEMPSLYDRFPDSKPKAPYMTTYRVFVGPGAAFEGRHGIPLKDFADGLPRTVLIVEASEAVPWTKPAELAYAPEGSLPALGSRLPGAFCAAFADGEVVWVPKPVTESALRAAITRSGRDLNEHIGR